MDTTAERFQVLIETDGAAFDDGGAAEVARILRWLANEVEDYGIPAGSFGLSDSNGNHVGRAGMDLEAGS